jgi:uncharacterized membrane protein
MILLISVSTLLRMTGMLLVEVGVVLFAIRDSKGKKVYRPQLPILSP